jgi:hypothetical protein
VRYGILLVGSPGVCAGGEMSDRSLWPDRMRDSWVSRTIDAYWLRLECFRTYGWSHGLLLSDIYERGRVTALYIAGCPQEAVLC